MNDSPSEMRQRPRVLLVNANSSQAVTEHLAAIAQRDAPHIDFVPLTPGSGPRYVLTPADVAIATHAVVAAVESHVASAGEPDACLVACFGEVGMLALRHSFAFPVLNMAESAILTALQLGTRYGIVAIGDHWPAMLHETVSLYGLGARYAGAFRVEGQPMALMSDPKTAADAITARLLALPSGSVDVVVLGGAALTGLAELVEPRVPFRLVDCLKASLAQIDAALLYRRIAGSGLARASQTRIRQPA